MVEKFKALSGFLSVAFAVTLGLTIYYATRICDETTPPKFNLQRPKDRRVSGLPDKVQSFTYIVFTDPQLGLYDSIVEGNDGTDWSYGLGSYYFCRLQAFFVYFAFFFYLFQ